MGAMAAPIKMQTMWLFLVSAASTAVDIRSAQREFPQLANVVYSICGLTDIDFSVSHPCAYSLFGMAYAFTECGHVHQADYSNFQNCILGCSTADNCETACADPDVKSKSCLSDCKTVYQCIMKAAGTATGQASANSELTQCFGEEAPTAAPTAPIVSGMFPPAAAPASVVALQVDSPAPAASPAAAPTAAASPAPAVGPAFTPREAITTNALGFVDAKCVCSKTGIIRGVTTGQPGCAKHGKEANANVEAYCYVEGDYQCGGAMSSDLHPGLFWVGCEKPNIHLLYPPTCEIRERANAQLFPVPAALPLKVPASSFEGSLKNMAPLPRAPTPLDDMFQGMKEWSGPMPPLWHAARSNNFVNEAFQNPVDFSSAPAPALPPPPPMMAGSPAMPSPIIIGGAPVAAVAASPALPPAMIVPPMAPAPAMALMEEAASGAGQLRGVRQH